MLAHTEGRGRELLLFSINLLFIIRGSSLSSTCLKTAENLLSVFSVSLEETFKYAGFSVLTLKHIHCMFPSLQRQSLLKAFKFICSVLAGEQQRGSKDRLCVEECHAFIYVILVLQG